MKRARLCLVVAVIFTLLSGARAQEKPPLRLVIAGLVHGHVSGFLRGAQGRTDVQIVGVFDPDAALLRSYGDRYKIPEDARSTSLATLMERVRPDAIAAFTNTHDHPVVVEEAARRHIHVMMEKPLAVSNADAQRIRRAADAGGDPGARQLRDDVVPEPRRDVDAPQGAQGRRRYPQDGGHGRPQRSQGHQRAAGVPGLAVRPGEERRRRAVRLRLLRRQPDDVDDGQPAAAGRHRDHAALPAGRLSARGRRGDDSRWSIRRRRASSRRRGTGPSAARTSRSTATTGWRSPPAAPACASRCRRSPSTPSRRTRGRSTSATRSHTSSPSSAARRKPNALSSLENNLIATEILDAARVSARTRARWRCRDERGARREARGAGSRRGARRVFGRLATHGVSTRRPFSGNLSIEAPSLRALPKRASRLAPRESRCR